MEQQVFNFGDSVRVLSDKAFSNPKDKSFQASGNVVIHHNNNSIYGESAFLSLTTGDVRIEGSVRYIGPDYTIYGSTVDYQMVKRTFKIEDARIISGSYQILGKTIFRDEMGVLTATDAEFTSCTDCPESWSIFGEEVRVTLGQYVKIKHAYFKSKGLILFYVPYVAFPIKTKRESGLLFPEMKIDKDIGISFKVPYFWAISRQDDLTLTPGIFGRRGWGSEFELRSLFGEGQWINIDQMQVFDRVYAPDIDKSDDVVTGKQFFRALGDVEGRYDWGHRFHFYLFTQFTKDLDIFRDFEQFVLDKTYGTELQRKAFVSRSGDLYEISAQGSFHQNLFYHQAQKFDNSYVQTLPQFNLSIIPVTLYQNRSSYFHYLSFNLDSSYTIFKQNHIDEPFFIRNARRLNVRPDVNLSLGQWGPVYLNTSAHLDLQQYEFPTVQDIPHAYKYLFYYKTSASLEIEKIFGVAYKKVKERELAPEIGQGEFFQELIGDIPTFQTGMTKDKEVISYRSYKHSQNIQLNHYHSTHTVYHGNKDFLNQISDPSFVGVFDFRDAFRENEFMANNDASRILLPIDNTLEIQWNHSLISKTEINANPLEDDRYLRDQFSYARIAYLNFSQGLRLDVSDVTQKLTRLHLSGGASYKSFGLNASEYYFHDSGKHIFNVGLSHSYSYLSFSVGYTSNEFSIPESDRLLHSLSFTPWSFITLAMTQEYDLNLQQSIQTNYDLLFNPNNNCWKLSLRYSTNLIKDSYSFDFLLNYNAANF